MPERVTFDPKALLASPLKPEQLDCYFELLMEQNRRVNLVSRETKRADFDRLVAESLLPLGFLPGRMNGYIDVGSGGGVPAIPILLSGQAGGGIRLFERTAKKARALSQILAGLELDARVVPVNFEETGDLPVVELITLRYVKLTRPLLTRIMSSLAPSGKFVYYAQPGPDAQEAASTVYEFESPQDSIVKSFTIFSK